MKIALTIVVILLAIILYVYLDRKYKHVDAYVYLKRIKIAIGIVAGILAYLLNWSSITKLLYEYTLFVFGAIILMGVYFLVKLLFYAIDPHGSDLFQQNRGQNKDEETK